MALLGRHVLMLFVDTFNYTRVVLTGHEIHHKTPVKSSFYTQVFVQIKVQLKNVLYEPSLTSILTVADRISVSCTDQIKPGTA